MGSNLSPDKATVSNKTSIESPEQHNGLTSRIGDMKISTNVNSLEHQGTQPRLPDSQEGDGSAGRHDTNVPKILSSDEQLKALGI